MRGPGHAPGPHDGGKEPVNEKDKTNWSHTGMEVGL